MELKLIHFSNTIKRKKLIAKAISDLKEFLKDIPDIKQLKNSDDLTEICCNVVEYLLASKSRKYHINKKSVVFEIFDEIFVDDPLTAEEKDLLGKRIDFLHEKGLITGVSFLRIVRKGVWEWFKKKVLN